MVLRRERGVVRRREDEDLREDTGQVWGRKVVEDFESQQQGFEVNSVFDRKPVELLKNRCNVVKGGGWGSVPFKNQYFIKNTFQTKCADFI